MTEQSVVPCVLLCLTSLQWLSAASLSLILKIWCLIQWQSQLPIFHTEGHSSALIWHLHQQQFQLSAQQQFQLSALTGSHLFHWLSEQSICSYLSPLLSQPFLLLLVCLCRRHSFRPLIGSEAGSLQPSVFSLSTQLLALAYIGTDRRKYFESGVIAI